MTAKFPERPLHEGRELPMCDELSFPHPFVFQPTGILPNDDSISQKNVWSSR